jgi:anti-anti-sigma regulatory factor
MLKCIVFAIPHPAAPSFFASKSPRSCVDLKIATANAKGDLETDEKSRKWSMYVVEIDQSKRVVVITAAQRVTAEQAKQTAEEIRKLLEDVPPGFRVLADFRWLDSMDSAAAGYIAEIMDTLAEKQVASVTRVMPDPHKDIGFNILSQFHYGPEIQIATYETLADALQSFAAQ